MARFVMILLTVICSVSMVMCSEAVIPSNILIIVTDDQDLTLGGMTPLTKTKKWLAEGGKTFENAFVTTPICCPSRSTILTGR